MKPHAPRSNVEARQHRTVQSLLAAAYDNLKQIEDHGVYHYRIRDAADEVRQVLLEFLLVEGEDVVKDAHETGR